MIPLPYPPLFVRVAIKENVMRVFCCFLLIFRRCTEQDTLSFIVEKFIFLIFL